MQILEDQFNSWLQLHDKRNNSNEEGRVRWCATLAIRETEETQTTRGHITALAKGRG
jgi:hypothetical protein